MVILGIGSNIGDRLENFRKALARIKQLPQINIHHVSPVYLSDALLPENAPVDWNVPYLNIAISCTTTLPPHALLKELKNIEWSIGRKPEVRHWGPRILDIDILAWDETIIESEELTVPHRNLLDRPFALWPLADIDPLWVFPLNTDKAQGMTAAQLVEKWGSRFDGNAPFHTQQVLQRIDTPQLMGVLNVTPDSFSDGGQFLELDKAIEQAIHLVNSGAEILDIGAESTRPNATVIDAHTEWQRLEPVLQAIKMASQSFLIKPKISIDTRHLLTAKKAIELGVDIINDVTGLDDIKMQQLIAEANIACVVMHHLSIPENRNNVLPRNEDPVAAVCLWGKNRLEELEKVGIEKEKIIFDPGISFGKMAEQSLVVLRNIDAFKSFSSQLLVGHSRKSFFGILSSNVSAERDIETAAIAGYLANKPIDYLRIHNVELCARTIRTLKALEK